jgi:hypothetical protein
MGSKPASEDSKFWEVVIVRGRGEKSKSVAGTDCILIDGLRESPRMNGINILDLLGGQFVHQPMNNPRWA